MTRIGIGKGLGHRLGYTRRGAVAETLRALTLTSASASESIAQGGIVGTVLNLRAGSTFTVIDTAGNRYTKSGNDIARGATALDYEDLAIIDLGNGQKGFRITLRESNASYAPPTRDTVIDMPVLNVFEAVAPADIVFSVAQLTTGTPSNGTISAPAAGWTIAGVTNLPAGLTVNIANRTFAWDGTGSVGTKTPRFTQTHPDSAVSPFQNDASLEVVAGSAGITIPNYASIVTFGSSTVAGTGASSAENGTSGRLGAKLGATVLNKAIGGTTVQTSVQPTDSGRSRFVADLTGSNKREAVFISYGQNDARYTGGNGSVSNYKASLREIVNGLLSLGYTRGTIYLGNQTYITDAGLSSGGPNYNSQTRAGFEQYVSVVAQVADEFGLPFADLYTLTNDAAFKADVDSNDNLHPKDFGHDFIAAKWLENTNYLNVRIAPATVSAVVTGGTINVAASAVSGAQSYEYALAQGFIDGTVQSSGAFVSVVAGTYRAKARAVFAGGGKSPWAFAAADSVVTVSDGFALDSFTGADNTLITARAPDIGTAWVDGVGNSLATVQIRTNRMFITGTRVGYLECTPPSADYYVEADFVKLTTASAQQPGLSARHSTAENTLYWFRWNESTQKYEIYRTVAGASTLLNSSATATFSPGDTHKVRLEVSGVGATVTLTGKVDGVTVASASDTNAARIVAAGRPGLRCAGTTSETTGVHLDNFKAGMLP